MKIAILLCDDDDEPEGSTEPLTRHLAEHEVTIRRIANRSIPAQIQDISARHDLIINLCDGAEDEDRAGIAVVRALERTGAAFTGAASRFYDPSRTTMKTAAADVGVRAPGGFIALSLEDLEQAEGLRYPLIVKHPKSYASTGLTKASRVTDRAGLEAQTARMIEAYGAALVEEFIEGREFTALAVERPDAEPLVYPPVEFRFPAGESFKHYELKWHDYAAMKCVPCEDPALAEKLMRAASAMFKALDGTGYGRCDFRVDADGEAWLLEINPNCGMWFPDHDPGSADFILMNVPGGKTDFLARIFEAARERRRENTKKRTERKPRPQRLEQPTTARARKKKRD